MKSKHLLVGVAVFLSLTVATFAQGTFTVSTTPTPGREGGGAEKVGDIVLTTGTAVSAGAIILNFSTDLTVLDDSGDVATDAPWIDFDNGSLDPDPLGTVNVSGNQLTIPLAAGTTGSLRVEGARVDLTGVTGTVTVTVSATGGNTVTAGQTIATVISSIQDPLVIDDVDDEDLLATGSAVTATVTLSEGFPSAFTTEADEEGPTPADPASITNGSQIRLVVSGLPVDSELVITVTGDFGGGDATVSGGCDFGSPCVADGEDLELTVTIVTASAAITEDLELNFFLDATEDTDVALPLSAGDIRASVSMWPDPDSDIPFFVTSFEEAVIFTIVPAQTTLLFPLVQVVGPVDTGLAIGNTTGDGFGDVDELAGKVKLWIFCNGAATVVYTTSGASPGEGLNSSGEVEPGQTWVVLLSQILDDAGFTGDCRGHVFAVADYTHAHATAFNGDFATFFHSDTATVIAGAPDTRAANPLPEQGGN